jgi:hypothetical protein
MTTEEQRRMSYLQNEIIIAHEKANSLMTKFQADCLSCRHNGTERCITCPVNMKSNYEPTGVDDAD